MKSPQVVLKEIVSVVLAVVFVILFSIPLGSVPPLGDLLNPNGGIWTLAARANHPVLEELRLPGLDGDVTVLRDDWGVPHIFATTNHDLFLALGYVHAQDRMWQMDIQYRFAAGRLSEILGRKYIDQDTFMRTIGLQSEAAISLATLSAADTSLQTFTAYAAGVNAWISQTPTRNLPLEFRLLDYRPEPWTPVHSAAEGGLLAFSLSADFSDIELGLLTDGLGAAAVDELFPVTSPVPVPPIVPNGTRGGGLVVDPVAARDVLAKVRSLGPLLGALREGAGSNNWVVAANRSATGRPLLAGDPHLRLQLPAVWYEVHLHGGDYDVYGVSLPGVPGVFIGFNRNIAWSETNTGADVTDFYRETVNPANPDQYRYLGQWRNFSLIPERIRVREWPDTTVIVKKSIHGPLVTQRGETLAMRWTGNGSISAVAANLAWMKASSWAEFRDALRLWKNPAQNFAFASWGGSPSSSTIAIRSNGLFPIRNNTLGRVPLDGGGDFEWMGWVPFDAYPEAVDPAQGYLVSANQIPAGAGYPYYLGWQWDPGYRAKLINFLLNKTIATVGLVSRDEMKAIQGNTSDAAAQIFVPFVLAAGCTSALCTASEQVLQRWDFRMETDRSGASIWYTFFKAFIQETFGDEWARANASDLMMPYPDVLERLVRFVPNSPWFDDVRTAGTPETRDVILRRAMETAVQDLATRLGPDPSQWAWGRIHVRTFDHLSGIAALSRGPYAAEGDDITIDPAPGLTARGGPSWRMVVPLGTPENASVIYPGGQSGNPLSPHYADQLPLWLARSYRDIVYPTAASLPAGRLESTLILRRA